MYGETVDYRSRQEAKKFAQSLRETGFLVLFNPILQLLIATVYKNCKNGVATIKPQVA